MLPLILGAAEAAAVLNPVGLVAVTAAITVGGGIYLYNRYAKDTKDDADTTAERSMEMYGKTVDQVKRVFDSLHTRIEKNPDNFEKLVVVAVTEVKIIVDLALEFADALKELFESRMDRLQEFLQTLDLDPARVDKIFTQLQK